MNYALAAEAACSLNVNDAAPLSYSAKTQVIYCEVIETA